MAPILRHDGRKLQDIRDIKITRNYTKYAEGSVLFSIGDTVILCNATVDEKVPPFLRGSGQGWITAEYSLLPRSTHSRVPREVTKNKVSGRTSEIQRIIGRCLRSVVDLNVLGEKTIWFDCDVLQADGGTRTAAINGAFIALVDAVKFLLNKGLLSASPIKNYLAAISVGILEGNKLVDLTFEEDSKAQVDMNFAGTDAGELVEIQGTAEGFPFSLNELNELISLGQNGIQEIIALQKSTLGSIDCMLIGKNTNESK